MKTKIYFFQWISELGGADTRLKELIQALSYFKNKFEIFCIPNDDFRLEELENTNFLKENHVTTLSWAELPQQTEGYAISFCNFRLFSEEWRIKKIKSMGLKFIWSNDMMWMTQEEVDCINNNLVDAIIYTSRFHEYQLKSRYAKSLNSDNQYKHYIVPNYFHLPNYTKHKRKSHLIDNFVLGKLSRADSAKYSENFPLFFEKMPLENPKFRIMGWSEDLSNYYSWHNFNENKWELLPENKEDKLEFLSQLDLYVFNAHHRYIENQSRAIIEAQLLGVPTVVPSYGNFPNMVWQSRNGYIYNSIQDLNEIVKSLESNRETLDRLGGNAKAFAEKIWCDKEAQIKIWNKIMEDLK